MALNFPYLTDRRALIENPSGEADSESEHDCFAEMLSAYGSAKFTFRLVCLRF